MTLRLRLVSEGRIGMIAYLPQSMPRCLVLMLGLVVALTMLTAAVLPLGGLDASRIWD